MRATAFERLVSQAGYRGIEIEAGAVGLVIYGPTSTSVAQVAEQLAGAARLGDPSARAERVSVEADEPAATRFVSTVHVDWERFGVRPAKASAPCVMNLADWDDGADVVDPHARAS